MQHTGIQEGLEDASRAAGRGNDVHLVPPPLVGRIGSVSGVGQYLPGLHVRYDRRQIIDMVGTVFTGITVYEGLCLSLQGLADGGLDALPRLSAASLSNRCGASLGKGRGASGSGSMQASSYSVSSNTPFF